ncbi:MAG TPA: carbonic anhydrase [Thermodesulfobacteriota bacterium]|nr:carbonic anhydrase [Thermodesulfobacteriota bacterium]
MPFNSKFTRLELLKLSGLTAIGVAYIDLMHTLAFVAKASQNNPTINGDEALQRLIEGNKLYASGRPGHPHQTEERRIEVASGQKPIAVVLGCSDSRVPPEVIFDQGLGDLFVVRVAGNIVDSAVQGSIEYAVAELGVPLIVVLGHQRCGAVKATVEIVEKGGQLPGQIEAIADRIKPAVESVKHLPGDILNNSIKANVEMVVGQLKNSEPILAKRIKEGKLKVVGATYGLDNGIVNFLA